MDPVQPRWNRLAPDVRREQILASARRIFLSQPYSEVSVTAIAQEAGVSRALVTHYFGGKRELFLELLRGLPELAGLTPRTDLGLPIEQVVAHNVAAWLDFMESNREIVLAFTSLTSLDRDPDVAGVVDRIRDDAVDRMLLNHLGTTDVPPAARLVLRGYTGLVQVVVADWLKDERVTRAHVEALLVEGLLALVREALPRVLQAQQP